MHLAHIHTYPIKSCAGNVLEEAVVEPCGLRHDRRWMVVDADGRFITGRQQPRLTLVRATPTATGLMLESPQMQTTPVVHATDSPLIPVSVWKSQLLAEPMGAEADDWFSDFLQQPVRLVQMDDQHRRAVAAPSARPEDTVSFADSLPLLLVTRAALDKLNARLPSPVSMLNFRPNLVVDDADAHAEDAWKEVRIGEVSFEVAKPCTRCVFITVDPQHGTRDASGEPLKTLIDYRRGADGVNFGQLLIPRSTGTLRIGDTVNVIR